MNSQYTYYFRQHYTLGVVDAPQSSSNMLEVKLYKVKLYMLLKILNYSVLQNRTFVD